MGGQQVIFRDLAFSDVIYSISPWIAQLEEHGTVKETCAIPRSLVRPRFGGSFSCGVAAILPTEAGLEDFFHSSLSTILTGCTYRL
jgi:hypothetical protein